jgi:hypothetical protein
VGGAIWGRVDWWNHRVNINVSRFNRFNYSKMTRNSWLHAPAHRGGVPYQDSAVAARFGDGGKAAGREASGNKVDDVRRDLAEPLKAEDAKPKNPRTSRSARSRHVRGSKAGGKRRAQR